MKKLVLFLLIFATSTVLKAQKYYAKSYDEPEVKAVPETLVKVFKGLVSDASNIRLA